MYETKVNTGINVAITYNHLKIIVGTYVININVLKF